MENYVTSIQKCYNYSADAVTFYIRPIKYIKYYMAKIVENWQIFASDKKGYTVRTLAVAASVAFRILKACFQTSFQMNMSNFDTLKFNDYLFFYKKCKITKIASGFNSGISHVGSIGGWRSSQLKTGHGQSSENWNYFRFGLKYIISSKKCWQRCRNSVYDSRNRLVIKGSSLEYFKWIV